MGAGDSPLVSVVVPTYERPTFLVDAVESVLAQRYRPIELVVVDDGSTADVERALADATFGDESLSDLTRYAVCRHDENRGANAARNTGIEAATGEYVAFLDDDDRWEPTKLTRQVAALRTADDAAVAFTGQRCVDASGTTTAVTRPPTAGDFLGNVASGAEYGPFSTVVVRANVFDEVGALDERFPCWQDKEWYVRLAAAFECVSVPDPLTVRRFTGHGQISDDYAQKRDVAFPLLIEKHRETVAEGGESYERAFLASLLRELAVAAARNGRRREAVTYLCRSLRHRPTRLRTYAYLLASLGGKYTWVPARACRRTLARALDG
ncbi:glycosyltransferase [Haloarcula nitratireducens]|uniref:Glycosyltransferase n=1 Tax=Haloarcula nitratireducens TaxID=2487749 RepID=A0AAW4P7S8_9EURY|nr:glycosyltransferase [Halomicroarcula nitratireducens]MBX0293813.1 glycosyltransferase [Halomicroarcula nitratireducens]